MSQNAIAITLSLLLSWGIAYAQRPAASEATPDELIKNISALAVTLQARIAQLETEIQQAKETEAQGRQVLDAMIGAVTGIHEALADNSKLWTELRSMLGSWEEGVKDAQNKSLTDARYQEKVQRLQARISKANMLRDQIITERARSLSVLQQIEKDKAWIIDQYQEGRQEAVLAGLNKVFEQFKSLNNAMQTLAGTSKQLG